MPNITEYTSPIDKLTPSETGVTATAQVAQHAAQIGQREEGLQQRQAELTRQTGQIFGRGISEAGNLAGQMYTQFVVQPEISRGGALLAQTQADTVDAWNTLAKANPNDPNLARKFNDQVLEPQIEKFQGAFQTEEGQKWAQAEAQRFREHMFTKTAADTSTMAGNEAVTNLDVTMKSLSRLSAADPTPATVDHAKSAWESAVEATIAAHPNLTADQASKLRTELLEKGKQSIEHGFIYGLGNTNPDAALDMLHGGYKFEAIDGADEERAVRTYQHAKHYDEALSRQENDRNAKVASDVAEVEFMKKLYSDDPAERAKATATSVLNDPNMSREAKERQVRIIDRELKPETATAVSNRNAIKILAGIRDGTIDNISKIYDARINGQVNRTDFEDLKKEFTEDETVEGKVLAKSRGEFMKRMERSIDGGMDQFGHSALGDQKIYQFEKDARRKEDELRKKNIDPMELYDPSSPQYFGKPENLAKYHVSLQDVMNSQKAAPPKTLNNEPVTGVEVFDIPPGMSPAEAVKKFGGGARVRLPDGGTATLPKEAPKKEEPLPYANAPDVPLQAPTAMPGAKRVKTLTIKRPEGQ